MAELTQTQKQVALPIYEAYPRHDDRSDALRKIWNAIGRVAKRLRKEAAAGPDSGRPQPWYEDRAAAWLLGRAERYAASPAVKSAVFEAEREGSAMKKKYVKMAGTWFYNDCYDDPDESWGYPPEKRAAADPGPAVRYDQPKADTEEDPAVLAKARADALAAMRRALGPRAGNVNERARNDN